MKILVVDDSKAMRMIVRRTLRQAGFDQHDVEEAENGAQALDIIRKAPPSVVLSDWNMPEMSGIQLLQAVREEGHKVKLGFVTSETADEMRSLAAEHGAAFMITKPFTEDTFRHVLEPILG
ncbi:MAG: response regulator [Immundisolibacter sp.]|uniref:response regulator n=1 Tax=Immundisolibacter sp. TaxID=1934948 RepID=UPI003D10CDB0